MAKKRHKPEEIVSKLRQVDVLVGQGQPLTEGGRAYRTLNSLDGFRREYLAIKVKR